VDSYSPVTRNGKQHYKVYIGGTKIRGRKYTVNKGGYNPLSTICKCCTHIKREYVEREVLSGRKDIKWGAEQLGVPYQAFWDHLQNHVVKKEDVEAAVPMEQILDTMIQELYKRFKRIVKIPDSQEREIKAAADSLNTCIMNIARLRKIITVGPQIQIQQFNMSLTKLIEFFHTELSPEQEVNVIRFLEKMQEVEE